MNRTRRFPPESVSAQIQRPLQRAPSERNRGVVNNANEIKVVAFSSGGPSDRSSIPSPPVVPATKTSRYRQRFKTAAANRDIARTTRGVRGRLIGGFTPHRSARTHATTSALLFPRPPAWSRRRIELEVAG